MNQTTLEVAFKEWWEASYGRPPGTHAVMTHVAFAEYMADQIRDLLIKLTSHMAYMQGQLEAHHEYDDPEDYYWYRESVKLRQEVIDKLRAANDDAND